MNNLSDLITAVGIGLTFLASISAVIVSAVSMKQNKELSERTMAQNKELADSSSELAKTTAERTAYLSSISTARERWGYRLRESASHYFAQLECICRASGEELEAAYQEFSRRHYAISLLLFERDEMPLALLDSIHGHAQALLALDSSPCWGEEEREETFRNWRLHKDAILRESQELLTVLRAYAEGEWRKQKYETTEKWEEKN